MEYRCLKCVFTDVDIKILRGDELFSKFPSAFNTVSDDVKSKLLKYLETKVTFSRDLPIRKMH